MEFHGKIVFEVDNILQQMKCDNCDITEDQISILQILLDIGNILESCDFENSSFPIESELSENLRLCSSIIDSLMILLNDIISNPPGDTCNFGDLPKYIGLLLLDIFKHCKNSETIYSSYFQQIGFDITNVFKKGRELQTLYFAVLLEHIHFDLSQDEQMNIFLQVLDVIGDIGEVVMSLDVKTMAEEWKGYSKLCEQHVDWLKNKYVHHKATVILSREIQSNLNSLVAGEINDAKFLTRCLKISNFILKVLIKIGELFCGCLSTNLNHFIALFSSIYQCSTPQLKYLGLQNSVIEGISSHIIVDTESLLLTLLHDVHFKQSYTQHVKVLASDKSLSLGNLLLNVTLMRLLLQVDQDVRGSWAGEEEDNNIVCCLFHILPFCSEDFDKGLKFDLMGKENISLYDHVLLNTAALTISCEALGAIEKGMFAAVLQTDMWSALLAIDLWTVVYRYGSDSFCFEQMTYLMKTFDNLCKSEIIKSMPQHVYFSHLLTRLFDLLPGEWKSQLLLRFPVSEHCEIWRAIGLHNLSDNRKTIEDVLLSSCNVLKEFFTERKCSTDDYEKMMNHVGLLSSVPGDLLKDSNSDRVPELVLLTLQAWHSLTPTDKLKDVLSTVESSVPGCQWLNIYITELCKLSSSLQQFYSNEQLTEILRIISPLVLKSQSGIKIAVLEFLKSLMMYTISEDFHKENLISLIATLFEYLLDDEDAIVRILSLEAFTHFARNTSNNNIVSQTVNGRRLLKERVTNFFLRKIQPSENTLVQDYYRQNPPAEFIHKCEKIIYRNSSDANFYLGDLDDIFENSGDVGAPVKKLKMETSSNSEVLTLINRLSDDSKLLTQICLEKNLTHELKHILYSVKETLTVLIDKK